MIDARRGSPDPTFLEEPFLFEAPFPGYGLEQPGAADQTVRVVPVFIIPGIMGTRLYDPATGRYVWNPTALTRRNGPFAANVKRLTQVPELAPIPRHDLPAGNPDYVRRAERVTNFGHLVPDFYDLLAFDLSSPGFDAAMRSRHRSTLRVIALGYDWRKDNRRGALRVRDEMLRHMQQLGAQRCIVVAHSMGGLVARWLCRHLRGERFVQALYLIGSPTHGSPQGYRLLKAGRFPGRDYRDLYPLFPLTSNATMIGMLRSFASTYQLLPTSRYCAAHPDWIDFRQVKAPKLPRDARDPEAIYRHPQLGFLDEFSRNPRRAAVVRENLDRRQQFDAGLGCYMPPRTFIVYGNGSASALRTESRYQLRGNPRSGVRLAIVADTIGDGTVPRFSASAAGCSLAIPARPVGSVGHSALPNDPTVRKILISAVAAEVARMSGAPRRPATLSRPLVAESGVVSY